MGLAFVCLGRHVSCGPAEESVVNTLGGEEFMTSARRGILSVTVVLLCLRVGLAGQWPNWRGPHFNGSADERDLPQSWTDTENVLWTAPLPGPAASTPAIWDGKVFVSSPVKDGDDLVALCFDARTGRQLWSTTVARSDRDFPRNNLATASPTTDGRHAFFLYGSGDLAALDFDGNIVWSRNIEIEYGNITCQFGYGASPMAFEGAVYIPVLRRERAWREPREGEPFDSFLLAVDGATGRTLWRHVRASDAQDESLDSYATPIPFRNGDRTEIVLIGADYVTAHDPQTGAELWRYCYATGRRDTRWRLIPSVVTGAGMVFGVQPRGGNDLFAIRPEGADGVLSQDRIAWTVRPDDAGRADALILSGPALCARRDAKRQGRHLPRSDDRPDPMARADRGRRALARLADGRRRQALLHQRGQRGHRPGCWRRIPGPPSLRHEGQAGPGVDRHRRRPSVRPHRQQADLCRQVTLSHPERRKAVHRTNRRTASDCLRRT
jgi:outer membrane protein assembly factor BamB